MTDKQAALQTLGRLPEDASLDTIAEEIQIMAAIRRGEADIAAGRVKSHEEVGREVESWAAKWNSK